MSIHRIQSIFLIAIFAGLLGGMAVGLSVVGYSQKPTRIQSSPFSFAAKTGQRWSICVRLQEGTSDAKAPRLAQYIRVETTSGLTVDQVESDNGKILWDRHGTQMRMFYEISCLNDGRITVYADQAALSHELVAVPFSLRRLAVEGSLFCLFCSMVLLGVLGYLAANFYGRGVQAGQTRAAPDHA